MRKYKYNYTYQYPAYVKKIVKAFREAGMCITEQDAERAWDKYSDSIYSANWLCLSDYKSAGIVEQLSAYFTPSSDDHENSEELCDRCSVAFADTRSNDQDICWECLGEERDFI